MKHTRMRLLKGLLFLVVCSTAVMHDAQAQGRRGEWDVFGSVADLGGDDSHPSGYPNIQFDLESTWTLGLGGAYHFTDRLSVLFDLSLGQADLNLKDFSAPRLGTLTQDADLFNGRVNLEFTPMAGRFSPVLSAGIGFNNFETAIPGAPPELVCVPGVFYWWCGAGVPTFNDTAFTYNAGLGLRMEVTPSLFVKLMYDVTWADFKGVDGTLQFGQTMLQIGGKFSP